MGSRVNVTLEKVMPDLTELVFSYHVYMLVLVVFTYLDVVNVYIF